MKSVVFILLVALLSFAACLYLPWWSIAIVAFVMAALIPQRPGIAFLGAFVAVFLLWFCLSFYLSYNNEHILANRISLLVLKTQNPWLLMLITALIGGIVSGFAALCASYIHPPFNRTAVPQTVVEVEETPETI